MKNENVERLAQGSKPAEVEQYVKPVVTKHTAASLLVGSSGCSHYSAGSDCYGNASVYYY